MVVGLIIISTAFFVFYKINYSYPPITMDSETEIYWLQNAIGSTGTLVLLTEMGLRSVWLVVKKLCK